MPWNCFGGKKKNFVKEPPYDANVKSSENVEVPSHVVVEKQHVQQQSSNLVETPVSNSDTPSTAVAGTPKDTSINGSPPASPLSVRGALRRAELAEKRREFFKDLMVDDPYFKHKYTNGSATLPSASMRARNFGEVKIMRPSSQPNSVIPSPTQPPSTPPPGPHLLRPASPNYTPKTGTSTFTSPMFLNELRDASDEISKRWQMSDEEREATPCSFKTKLKAVPVIPDERSLSLESPNKPDLDNTHTVSIQTTTITSKSESIPIETQLIAEPTQTVGSEHSSCSASPPSLPTRGRPQLGPEDCTEKINELSLQSHKQSSDTEDTIEPLQISLSKQPDTLNSSPIIDIPDDSIEISSTSPVTGRENESSGQIETFITESHDVNLGNSVLQANENAQNVDIDVHSNSSLAENDVFDDNLESDLNKPLVSDDDEEFEREILKQYKVTEPGFEEDFPIDGRDVFTDSDLQNFVGSPTLSSLEVIPEVTQLSEDEAQLSPDPTPSPIETGSISSENSEAHRAAQNQTWQEDDSVPLIEDKTDDTSVQKMNENAYKTIN